MHSQETSLEIGQVQNVTKSDRETPINAFPPSMKINGKNKYIGLKKSVVVVCKATTLFYYQLCRKDNLRAAFLLKEVFGVGIAPLAPDEKAFSFRVVSPPIYP